MKTFSVIDIETINCTDERLREYLTASVKADSRLKDPAKVEADLAEKREAAISKSGFDGGFGMLAIIGVAGCNHFELDSIISNQYCNESGTLEGERELLRSFWMDAHKMQTVRADGAYSGEYGDLVGHNLKWDMRFIMQRTVVHGLHAIVRPDLFELRNRFSKRIHDTMELWAGWGERVSLDRLCTILGVETPKGAIDGSQVNEYWTTGRQDEVKRYNTGDLQATALCFRKMLKGGMV